MITQELVKKLFTYKDGSLIRIAPVKGSRVGQVVGTNNGCGYLSFSLNRKRQKNHRIIFLYHRGYLPECIDHIDGDSLNNRIENLRACTMSENQYNRKMNKNNKSGIKGVGWAKREGKWVARIQVNKKQKHVGFFNNLNDAAIAVEAARKQYHGEFANQAVT